MMATGQMQPHLHAPATERSNGAVPPATGQAQEHAHTHTHTHKPKPRIYFLKAKTRVDGEAFAHACANAQATIYRCLNKNLFSTTEPLYLS